MKKLSFFLVGLLLGVFLGAEAVDLAGRDACPQSICVEEADIVPISDRGFFPVVHERLQKAQRSIHIAAFEFKYYPSFPGSQQNILVEDLIAAKRRGVEVRVLVDEYASEDSAVDYLRENGVEVRYDSAETTTHAKLLVIDNETVVLGSTNFSFYGLEKNNEVDVLILSGRVAGYFEEYFTTLWNN